MRCTDQILTARRVVAAGLVVLVACTIGCTTSAPPSRQVPLDIVPPGSAPVTQLVFIPGGVLRMGDHSGAGYVDERPVHELALSPFYIDQTEVPWSTWIEVYNWALTAGYQFEGSDAIEPPRAIDHPVCNVTWYDAVKWANARSEMSGRKPVYYTDASRNTVYRAGQIDIPAEAVDWTADGFRLPTEAEWEWAARGGLHSQHYPWPSPGDAFTQWIDGTRANYWQSGDPYETETICATTPVAYFRGDQQPPGTDMANGYGLYDMAGNVAEWCWDWYDDQWYASPDAQRENTTGPLHGPGRVIRGGSWISSDKYSRVSVRYMSQPGFRCHCYGLRLVVGDGSSPR